MMRNQYRALFGYWFNIYLNCSAAKWWIEIGMNAGAVSMLCRRPNHSCELPGVVWAGIRIECNSSDCSLYVCTESMKRTCQGYRSFTGIRFQFASVLIGHCGKRLLYEIRCQRDRAQKACCHRSNTYPWCAKLCLRIGELDIFKRTDALAVCFAACMQSGSYSCG